MNRVDRLLAKTADFLEDEITADPDLHTELMLLFEAGQHPSIIRSLRGFPENLQSELLIAMGAPDDADD